MAPFMHGRTSDNVGFTRSNAPSSEACLDKTVLENLRTVPQTGIDD
jgi:hypothetical protein